LYQSLLDIQHGSTTPLTPEKRALIERCQTQLREEQARIRQLQQGLWWPFHRASLRFFELWLQGITQLLTTLDSLLRAAPAPQGVSIQDVQERLLLQTTPASSALSSPLDSAETWRVPTPPLVIPDDSREQKVLLEAMDPTDPTLPLSLQSLPIVPVSSLEELKAQLAESQARDQQFLEEAKREYEAFRTESRRELVGGVERDRQLLEQIQQGDESAIRQLQQEREDYLKQLRREREAVEQQLQSARAERLMHTHPDLFQRSMLTVPLAQARSAYFSFCGGGVSSFNRYER